MNLARVRKALIAAVAFAAVIAAELPPGSPDWLKRWAPVVLAVAGVAGVYKAKNAVPTPPLPTISGGGVGANPSSAGTPPAPRRGKVIRKPIPPVGGSE